jgi:hypothetical protein
MIKTCFPRKTKFLEDKAQSFSVWPSLWYSQLGLLEVGVGKVDLREKVSERFLKQKFDCTGCDGTHL